MVTRLASEDVSPLLDDIVTVPTTLPSHATQGVAWLCNTTFDWQVKLPLIKMSGP